MPLTSPFSIDPPCLPRRKKTSAERRAQRQRSEARFLQRALSGLNDVHLHRGGTLTRFAFALRQALSHLSSCDEVLPSCSEGPSMPDVFPPTLDAVAAQFHGVPADGSFLHLLLSLTLKIIISKVGLHLAVVVVMLWESAGLFQRSCKRFPAPQ